MEEAEAEEEATAEDDRGDSLQVMQGGLHEHQAASEKAKSPSPTASVRQLPGRSLGQGW